MPTTLLQRTFVKAWLNIDYFRAEAKLSTWLYRIALNEYLTFPNKQRAASTVVGRSRSRHPSEAGERPRGR